MEGSARCGKRSCQHVFQRDGSATQGRKVSGALARSGLDGRFTLTEADDATLIYEQAVIWICVMDMRVVPVIEDEDASPVLAKVFGK